MSDIAASQRDKDALTKAIVVTDAGAARGILSRNGYTPRCHKKSEFVGSAVKIEKGDLNVVYLTRVPRCGIVTPKIASDSTSLSS